MKTIADIRDNGLCSGCGTCVGVCPSDAIVMVKSNLHGVYLPKIDMDKCRFCQLCVTCCPGYQVDFQQLNLEIFGQQPSDRFLGNFLKCYVGHSNDHDIRFNSASGGIASQLLIFALEKGIIDSALVVGMKEDKPLEPKPFVARTKGEILSAARSKYCPVPANEAVKQILKEEGRFAVVGLPCHIHGIRKAEHQNPRLKKKIVLHVCLMCSHAVNFMGTEFVIEKLHAMKDQISELRYRGKGWPGSMTIKLRNGFSTSIPLVGAWNSYWPIFSSFLFTPMRCTMCPDQTGELADISLGDAWLPELRSDRIGESIIVTRTSFAEDVLSKMVSAKVISAQLTTPEKVKQSQALNLKFKKCDLSTRLTTLSLLGRQIPVFIPKESSWSPLAFLRALYIYFNIRISSDKHLRSLLVRFPIPFFRLYFGLYKFLSTA